MQRTSFKRLVLKWLLIIAVAFGAFFGVSHIEVKADIPHTDRMVVTSHGFAEERYVIIKDTQTNKEYLMMRSSYGNVSICELGQEE